MTAIEWTERTWNPTGGCTIVSPGCKNCYAMKEAARGHLRDHPKYAGTTEKVKGKAVWTGTIGIGDDKAFSEPLRRKMPTMWFVNSMSDLFHEGIPDSVIDRVFAIMALCPQHTFQVLTKRADRMRDYMRAFDDIRVTQSKEWLEAEAWIIANSQADATEAQQKEADDFLLNRMAGASNTMVDRRPLPNVWLGVSVEDQARADARIPALLDTPAAVRFVSAEPLLGAVDFRWVAEPNDERGGVIDSLDGRNWIWSIMQNGYEDDTIVAYRPGYEETVHRRDWYEDPARPRLDWVIVGGESGPGARECDLAHIRIIVEQCAAADVPVFVKQIGARAMLGGHRWGTVHRKGGNPADWPKALRVRQMPGGVA